MTKTWIKERHTVKLFVGNGEYRDTTIPQWVLRDTDGNWWASITNTGHPEYPYEWATASVTRRAGTLAEAKDSAETYVQKWEAAE